MLFHLGAPVRRRRGRAVVRVVDDARKCVVLLGRPTPGSTEGMEHRGTGFLVVDGNQNSSQRYLVTTRRIAKDLDDGEFCLRARVRGGGSEIFRVATTDWFRHPDTTVDIAATPLVLPPKYDAAYFETKYFRKEDKVERNRINVGDPVQIIGMFRLLKGKETSLPFVHAGHVAYIPGEDGGIPERHQETGTIHLVDGYLVEALSHDALSGSPVFVDRRVRVRREGPADTPPRARKALILLGLMQGTWDVEPGEILANDRGPNYRPRQPAGTGIVVPAPKIVETLAMAHAPTHREAVLEAANAAAPAALPALADNPRHREDFKGMLEAAIKRHKSDGAKGR